MGRRSSPQVSSSSSRRRLLNALPQWTGYHDDLQWGDHLVRAPFFSRYAIPIESDGPRFHAWSIEEPGSTWESLLRGDRFLSHADWDGRPTFAYRVLSGAEINA